MLKKPLFILIIFAVIFGAVSLWLVTPLPTDYSLDHRFDWPDETANYFWSKKYASTGFLSEAEPLNLVAANQIHPRSFNVLDNGSLVPGSFLGLILLFGTIAKFFGSGSIIYYTPILSLAGVFAFYFIIKKIFNERVAFISAFLMMFHPAWWYYSVTSMLPNVVFISFILVSVAILIIDQKVIKSRHIIFSAIFFGLAISIRPSEIIWILAVYLAALILVREKIKFIHLLLFLIISSIVFLPSLNHQKILYGDFLTSGYSQLQSETYGSCQACELIKSLFLPFGFHPGLVVTNLWTHYLSRLWWLSLITLLGLVAFLSQRKQSPVIFGYVIMSLFIFGWLGVYYGSWEFTDKLTAHLNTLGLSYVRYWLPLFLLAIPFTANGLIFITNLFFKNHWKTFSLVVAMALLFYMSADLVLQKKPDSILPVKQRIATYKKNANEVLKLTESDSVIVTVRKDKLFFPERKVIHTFDALYLNNDLSSVLSNLIRLTPVYYYALGPEPSIDLNNNLILEKIADIDQEILYQVKNK